SDTHVVLATLKRSQSELSSFQRKVFKIDDHMGIAIAGLTGDGRSMSKYMRNECINHRYVYESAMPVGRLVRQLADKSQVCTQRSWKRPYGVGLLVAGVDAAGPHLFNTCPSGNYFEYKAMAIGARSQAAKTYLEKHFESFPAATLDDLIRHSLRALQASLSEGELSAANSSVAVVGAGMAFTLLEDDAVL
ncbi:Proteasome subunit alpha type-1-A, partial [Tetrabaena socialis]